MIWTGILSIVALISFALTGAGAYKWRKGEFPLSWWFLVAMSTSNFSGFLFHLLLTNVYSHEQSATSLVSLSRFAFALLYITLTGVGFEALRRKRNGQ